MVICHQRNLGGIAHASNSPHWNGTASGIPLPVKASARRGTD